MIFSFKNGSAIDGKIVAKAANVYIVKCGTEFFLVNKHALVESEEPELPEDGEIVY